MTMMKPPQSHLFADPPTQAHQTSAVLTLSANNMALKDYADLIPALSKAKAKTDVHIRVELLTTTHMLDEENGLLEALFDASENDIYTSHVIKALLQHLWRSYGFQRFLCTFALVMARLVAFFALTAYWSTTISALLITLSGMHAAVMIVQIRGMGWRGVQEPAHLLEAITVVVQLVIGLSVQLSPSGNDPEGGVVPTIDSSVLGECLCLLDLLDRYGISVLGPKRMFNSLRVLCSIFSTRPDRHFFNIYDPSPLPDPISSPITAILALIISSPIIQLSWHSSSGPTSFGTFGGSQMCLHF
jgi:hypothetical protein